MVFRALFRRSVQTRSIGTQACDANWYVVNKFLSSIQGDLMQTKVAFDRCQKQVNDNIWMEIAENLMDLLDGKIKELDKIARQIEQQVIQTQQAVEEKKKNLKSLQRYLFDITRKFVQKRKDVEWEAWDKKQLQRRYQVESEMRDDLRKDQEMYQRKLVFVQNRVVIVENQANDAEVYLDEMLLLRTNINEGYFAEMMKQKNGEAECKAQRRQLESFEEQGGYSSNFWKGLLVNGNDLKLMREEAIACRMKIRNVNQLLEDQNQQSQYLNSVNSLLKEKVKVLEIDMNEEREKYRHIQVSRSNTELKENGTQQKKEYGFLHAIPMIRDDEKLSTASLPDLQKLNEEDNQKTESSSSVSNGSSSHEEENFLATAPMTAVHKLKCQASPSGFLARLKSFTLLKN